MRRASLPLVLGSLAALAGLAGLWGLVPRREAAPLLAPLRRDAAIADSVERPSPELDREPEPAAARGGADSRVVLSESEPASRPNGTISGQVVRSSAGAEVPIGGSVVRLWRFEPGTCSGLTGEGEALAQTRTTPDGRFGFTGLAPGDYVVSSAAEPARVQVTWCRVQAHSPDRRVRILYGTAAVHGILHDDEGAPIAGRLIDLQVDFPGGGVEGAGLRTDQHGRFSFEGLPLGKYLFCIRERGGATSGAWPVQRIEFKLGEGERRRLELGGSSGLAHWRGTVRRTDGSALKRGGALSFECGAPEGGEPVIHIESTLDENGAFDVALPNGLWRPSIRSGSGCPELRTLQAETVGWLDFREDLTLPGALLTGSVVDSVTLRPRRVPGPDLRVVLRREDPAATGGLRSAPVSGDGRYKLDDLGPGDWLVSVEPLRLAVVGAGVRLHIGETDVERVLDLQVQEP